MDILSTTARPETGTGVPRTHMERTELAALVARHMVAAEATRSPVRPSDETCGRRWHEAVRLLRADRTEVHDMHRAFLTAWDDEVAYLWSRSVSARPDVGPRIRELHREAELTPTEISKALDMSRQYLYKIYSEGSNPTTDLVSRLLNLSGNVWGDLDYRHRRGQ